MYLVCHSWFFYYCTASAIWLPGEPWGVHWGQLYKVRENVWLFIRNEGCNRVATGVRDTLVGTARVEGQGPALTGRHVTMARCLKAFSCAYLPRTHFKTLSVSLKAHCSECSLKACSVSVWTFAAPPWVLRSPKDSQKPRLHCSFLGCVWLWDFLPRCSGKDLLHFKHDPSLAAAVELLLSFRRAWSHPVVPPVT